MSNDLKLERGFSLSPDTVNRRIAILGMQGSGKSNTATILVEWFLSIHAQTVILDNDGSWYGLRLDASGKGKGFDIPVFGGLHGDIPLDYRSGALVADLVVDKSISVVMDVSMFRKGQRRQFAMEFAEQLFFRKKEKRGPMMFVVEEAQDFIPQRIQKGEERMLGAFEDIGKGGRKYGIGSMIISQRPQSVNKDALNQAEILFVHQTYGAQERKALSEWIVDKGMDKQILEELPSLEIGEAYVWSPRWLKTIRRIQVPLKRTFDAAATPKFGKKAIVPRSLDPVDLEQIQQAMQQVIKDAEANDPKALKSKLALMTAEKDSLASELVALIKQEPKVRIERIEVPIIQPEVIEALREQNEALSGAISTLVAAAASVANTLQAINAVTKNPPPDPRQFVRYSDPLPIPRNDARLPSDEMETLPEGEMRVLIAIAQHPGGVERDQLSILTGFKRSTRDAYVSRLKKKDYIHIEVDGFIAVTEKGKWALGANWKPLPTGRELLEYWLKNLPDGESRVLSVLAVHYPHAMSRDEITVATDFKRSTRDAYISRLKARKLIQILGDGSILTSGHLF